MDEIETKERGKPMRVVGGAPCLLRLKTGEWLYHEDICRLFDCDGNYVLPADETALIQAIPSQDGKGMGLQIVKLSKTVFCPDEVCVPASAVVWESTITDETILDKIHEQLSGIIRPSGSSKLRALK
jgi:hypothetical protein